MRIFTLGLLSVLFFTVASVNANAQCTRPQGMTAQPYKLQGLCYIYIQFAIPNSNVSIANVDGYVAQGTAGPNGAVTIPYDCAKAPITGVQSLTVGGQICTQVQFAQEVILPVKFESITVEVAAAGGALLKWSTSFEFNNAKYIVEKSADGRSYSAVGEVAGAVNSIELNKYSFTDASYKAGDVSFYRLKQVDFDGTTSFSKVVYINSSAKAGQSVRVAPNPFLNEDIQLIGVKAADMNKNNIRVFNLAGKQLSFEISGSNAIRLDPSLPKGVYFVNIGGASHKLLKN
ncbi:T9SS type A sorting domain-containing protein [Terrimonas sp. NA20]|uniref:T9SS type A sorting domain-containing protein n=1 Tax=Terrimonas ginsenosidimutans TaxID=2908004 RepID=A0ABS9KXM4_9BACT|nr:T9SS type A sorting domain-containing protein [Terrimonas ginsenosidimutans]MCG2617089.1 T9SS type A sorting domain-containing protein [Terrimonas ginsenosidimutans]